MSENNYHSRLLDVSKRFDHVIERLKSSYIDEKYQMHWVLWLLSSPTRDLAKIKNIQNGIEKLLKSSLGLAFVPFISFAAGPFFIGQDIPMYFKNMIAGSLGYLFTMFFYFPALLNFHSDHFHTGAYRFWRRQEYNLFKSAFLDNREDFYFKGLYDFVTRSGEIQHLVDKRLGDFLQNERTDYKSQIRSLQDQLEQANKSAWEINNSFQESSSKYEDFIEELFDQRDELIKELDYLIQLLKDINMLLYRKFNGTFSKKDLNILTGFTLYELRENKLVLIEDVQTSSASPKEICLDEQRYSQYGAVKVILDQKENIPYVNEPYTGHMVISYRLNMDNKGTWVYNFHFDKSDDRVLKLLVENGKIDSREIYRLVHALCLLSLEDDYFSKKEAVNK